MTRDELLELIEQYRAGLDAEITLLHRLEALSARQREITQAADLTDLSDIVDARDRTMAGLVSVEHELRPVREQLSHHRAELSEIEEFGTVAALHAEAGALINGIVTTDRDSFEALREAELSRRMAAQTVGQGESTLAAYRRTVSQPPAASLVNRKG